MIVLPLQGEPEKKSAVEIDNEDTMPFQASTTGISAVSSTIGEQTTLVHNEEEAFALEPLDITTVPGKPADFQFSSLLILPLIIVMLGLIFEPKTCVFLTYVCQSFYFTLTFTVY